jgi:hypothetical protein
LPRIAGRPSVDTFWRTMARHREPVLLSITGSAVIIAGALIALGLSTGSKRAALAPAGPAAAPRATASPVVVLLPRAGSSAAATPLLAAGDVFQARRASGEKAGRRRRAHHREARLRELPVDLTLNPFGGPF